MTPDTHCILTVPLQIRVGRTESGKEPFASLDAIRDYLTEAAAVVWNSEEGNSIPEHEVTAMQIDWEKLQHGMMGETCWKCQECDAPVVRIDNFELLDTGDPWCSECNGPMMRTITNRIKCVQVEWAGDYFGGDYGKSGVYAYIPFSLIDEIKNHDGEAVMDDKNALEIAFRKVTGEHPVHIIHYTLDVPFDHDGNYWK